MRDYTQQLTVEQFGAMNPDREPDGRLPTRPISRIHPDRGTLAGQVRSGRRRTEEDRASAVLLIGTLGSGKTVAAEAIEYAAERRGSLVVDFDPKPDHALHLLPELEGRVQVLERLSSVTLRNRASSTRSRSVSRTCERNSPARICLSFCPATRRRGRTPFRSRSRTP